MNRKELITSIEKQLKDFDMTIEEMNTENNYLSEYGPLLDLIVSNISDQGFLLIDSSDSYGLMHTCSIWVKDSEDIVTIILQYDCNPLIESVEDIADIILEGESVMKEKVGSLALFSK